MSIIEKNVLLKLFFLMFIIIIPNIVRAEGLDCPYKIKLDDGNYVYYKFTYTKNGESGLFKSFIPKYDFYNKIVKSGNNVNWYETNYYLNTTIIQNVPLFKSDDGYLGISQNIEIDYLGKFTGTDGNLLVNNVILDSYNMGVCPNAVIGNSSNKDATYKISFTKNSSGGGSTPGGGTAPIQDKITTDCDILIGYNGDNPSGKLYDIIHDNKVYLHFWMLESGERKLQAYVKLNGDDNLIYYSNIATVIPTNNEAYLNITIQELGGTQLTFVMHRTQVDEFYKQEGTNSNTFTCYKDKIYITDFNNAGAGQFFISTTNTNGYVVGSDSVLEGDNERNDYEDSLGNIQFNPENPRLEYSSLCSNDGIRKAVRIIGYILSICKWVVPLIIMVLGMLDYGKAMMSNDEKALSKATTSLLKRFVAGVVVILTPTIILAIMNAIKVTNNIENDEFGACTTCLLKPSECGKGVEINNDTGGKPTSNGNNENDSGGTASNSSKNCLVKQWDSRWGNTLMYDKTLSQAGCALTSVAMGIMCNNLNKSANFDPGVLANAINWNGSNIMRWNSPAIQELSRAKWQMTIGPYRLVSSSEETSESEKDCCTDVGSPEKKKSCLQCITKDKRHFVVVEVSMSASDTHYVLFDSNATGNCSDALYKKVPGGDCFNAKDPGGPYPSKYINKYTYERIGAMVVYSF